MSSTVRKNNVTTIGKLLSIDRKVINKNMYTGGYVKYDDDVVVYMSNREIILTRYLLSILETIPAKLPIPSKFVVSNYYSNGIYTSKTMNSFWSDLLKYMVEMFLRDAGRLKYIDNIYKEMYIIVNEIYNDVVYEHLEYMTDIDIRDFLEVQLDDRLMQSILECGDKKTVDSVNHAYDVLDIVLRDSKYSNNRIAEGYIAGTMNPNQIKQMLAPRGFVTEINSQLFKIPVTSSFVLGMKDLYEIIVESRSGAKALYISTIAVEKSEYFAREWQLVTAIVDMLEDGDCGSTDYVHWKVRTSEEAGGKSDIVNMEGKWYFDDVDKKLKVISKHDHFLEGKTIKLRSAHKCKLARKSSICQTCFGELAYGVFAHSNLGHYTSTTTSGSVTQNMLSTKHLSSSAKGGSTKLSDVALQFFTIKNGNSYHFRSSINLQGRSKYRILINQDEGFGIKDLNKNIDPTKINPGRVSKIKSFYLEVEDDKGAITLTEIKVRSSNIFGVLSKEFISYLITFGYTLDDYERIVVDLSNWDKKNAVLYTPEMEFNFLELSKEIKNMFKYMSEPEDMDAMLQKLFDLSNSKLNINIALLEVIVYAFSCMDVENGDYRLGRGGDKVKACRIEDNIVNRSLGAAYGWELVLHTILSPHSFYSANAISHPMDVYIDSAETVKAYHEGTILK